MKQSNRTLAAVLLSVFAGCIAPLAANAAGASSGSSFKMIDTGHSIIRIPVYPGAKNDATKHLSIDDGTGVYSLEGYTTHDSVDAVYGWYAAHLTTGWTNKILHYNGATTGALKMQDGKVEKNILIQRLNGITNITMSEKDKK